MAEERHVPPPASVAGTRPVPGVQGVQFASAFGRKRKCRAILAPVENRYAFSNPDDAVEQFNSLLEEGRQKDAAQLLDAAMHVYPDDPRLPLAMGIGWM